MKYFVYASLIVQSLALKISTSNNPVLPSHCPRLCECPEILPYCEADATLQDMVANIVDEAYNIGIPEDDACAIGQHVSIQLQRKNPGTKWIVFVGGTYLFTSTMNYDSKHNYKTGKYLRFNSFGRHDFEIFEAVRNIKPPTIKPGSSSTQNASTINISPFYLPSNMIKTDMTDDLEEIFKRSINDAFDQSNGVYNKATQLMNDSIKKVCQAEFIYIVGRYGILSDSSRFCAIADRYPGTTFEAVFRKLGSSVNAHEVMIFGPA